MKTALKNLRSVLAFIYDIAATAFAWVTAYYLRFNFQTPQEHVEVMIDNLWLILATHTIIFIGFGLYRGTWRYASIADLKRIFLAVVSSSVILCFLMFMIATDFRIPRSVMIINPILLILMMGGGRFFYRMLKERQLFDLYSKSGEPVIVLGAGEAAVSLLRDLAKSKQWHVVGILDEDKSMHGLHIQGVTIHGGIDKLSDVAHRYGVRQVIIALPLLSNKERCKLFDFIGQLGYNALTVPAIDDLISGRLSISQIRHVEIEDLLGRETVNLDSSGLQSLFYGQTVLVSGAGGSIGSELCRQIIKFNPSHLICFDICEYFLYQLEQELRSQKLSIQIVFVIGDVRDANRLHKLLKQYKPKVVFHAAAYKHVPLMEHGNVAEAFDNNVLGTFTLAQACKKTKVDKFILISTDKAVNPTNVMGATKRLAEMVCQGLQEKTGTRFVIVRFGNVLGSSGSVIPKFREQINMGGPITVTHPEITRYFMSIPEAAQLVMQAGFMGKGGEILLLDMGEPIRILDLAKSMIRLSGFNEDEIKIEFTGLRPGEKLYEETLADDETNLPTPHNKLRVASARAVDEKWVSSLLEWISTTLDKDESLVKEELKYWVEEYQGDIHAG
jgi:FlaA1/EpsC-like NDP-sugar epimerase